MATGNGGVLQITVDSEDVEQLLTRVGDALDTVGMYTFLHTSVGPWLRERAKARFADEGDDVVGKWAPLQPATNDMRQAAGFSPEHPINHRTGELEAYITGTGWDIAASAGLSVLQFPGGAPSGSTEKKVRTAQAGAPFPQTVPRPVLGVNETDLAFVLSAMATYISLSARI